MAEKINNSNSANYYNEDDLLTNDNKQLFQLIKNIYIFKFFSYLKTVLILFAIVFILNLNKFKIKEINNNQNFGKKNKYNKNNITIKGFKKKSQDNYINNCKPSEILKIDDKQPNIPKNLKFNKNIKNNNISYYIAMQNDFCRNPGIYNNTEFDESIIKSEVNLSGVSYSMYVFKENDRVSDSIRKNKNWESKATLELVNALNFYKKKKSISNNENIFIIDIGANIGWYTTFLAKLHYSVISFEPGKKNNYILKKNCCLNNFTNIILINKGLYSEETISELRHIKVNVGNAQITHDIKTIRNISNTHPELIETIELTKLSNFVPFLKSHNLAAIKADVEGSEGQVFKGGKELITKYHVPFILTEFCKEALQNQNTSISEFLNLFYNNGYKLSTNSFFAKDNKNLKYFLNLPENSIIEIYAVYKAFLK